MNVITHYDLLIDEGNDPFRDPPQLRAYMDLWDGETFLQALALRPEHQVLEIGVGTGRLAARTAPRCAALTGIDISPKTIARARENLAGHRNISLVCADFLQYETARRFDVIYSSLTLMHVEDKALFLSRAAALLRPGGRLCLSLDKNQSSVLDMGTRKLTVYPDTPESLIPLLPQSGLSLADSFQTEFAYILICKNDL